MNLLTWILYSVHTHNFLFPTHLHTWRQSPICNPLPFISGRQRPWPSLLSIIYWWLPCSVGLPWQIGLYLKDPSTRYEIVCVSFNTRKRQPVYIIDPLCCLAHVTELKSHFLARLTYISVLSPPFSRIMPRYSIALITITSIQTQSESMSTGPNFQRPCKS